eukprot:jgi/Phyca11/541412/estExt2_Genewise1Plus.C_PHYCAscaffold_60726
MSSNKIHPNIAQQRPKSGENLVAVGLEITGPTSATLLGRTLHEQVAELVHVLYFSSFGPIVNFYKRLPWLTRKTISVSVALSAALYIFITVPFRISFYYNLHLGHDDKAHLWTRELTLFSLFDGVVDIVGLFNFVAFYKTWKSAFYELSKKTSAHSGKSRPSDADRHSSVKTVVRQHSSAHLQLGRVNWTISSIKPLSSMPGDDMNRPSSQQKFLVACNIEFLLECVALIPLEIIPLVLGNYNLLHLVRVTKLCRIYRLRSCFARAATLYSDRDWVQHLSSTGVDSLGRTIGICAGLCHWVACGYMFLGHAQCGLALDACDGNIETSWVIRDRLRGASVRRKYGRTLYWAARTLVLLGYDDVTPVSNVETLYGIIVNLLGALCGSSLLANFLFLFRFRNARYAAYSTHVDNAREYMRLQNIPRAIRQQVTAYFNYAWSTHHSLDSEDALQLLPQHLQSKVIATIRANRIAQVCFLMKESVEFINELALSLVRQVFSPGDQIIEPKVNAKMFFVIRGQVLVSPINGTKPTECKTGDSFAEMCLLLPEFYLQRAIAKTFCELYVLTKAKFDAVLSEYHPGRETQVRHHMAGMLERYKMQLRKTRKILGLQDGYENLSGKSSVGRFSAGQNSVRELKKQTNWRFPDSSFRLLWDSLRLVAVIYVAFEVPYFAVFTSMAEDQHMFVVNYVVDLRYAVTTIVEVFFALDLMLRSRYFVFMDHNAMLAIVRPDLIFSTYKTNGFYLDFIAWLPVGIVLDALLTSDALFYSSFFRLLRMLRLRLLPTLLQELADSYGVSSKLRIVTALVLSVTLMLHIVGCLWFEMSLFSTGHHSDAEESALLVAELTRSECLRHATLYQNCSWVKFDCYAHLGLHFPQEDPESGYQASFAYLRSVYWAMVTLTAVGYGDIVAYSTAESYFAAFWAFLGGIINFGVMGAMSSTISNMMATHHHHMEKLTTVNSIMERVNLSKRLSGEIRKFYHQQFVGRKQAYESQLLSHLPDELCYQISTLLHSKAVKSVQLFDSATIEFQREITGKFRHRNYQNGETICLEGDICRKFFVFLQGSKVNVFYRSRKVPIRALHEGDCYGVNEFMLERSYPATLIAASYVHASVLSREQFEVIQRKFADDLRDIRVEAHTYSIEDRASMKRIMTNLARIKLQPHLLQTPSLFYQRDNVFITNTDEETGGHGVSAPNIFLTCWLALIAFWNLYNAGFVIFRICFYTHLHFSSSENIAVWITDLTCDVCFAIDVYLRLYYFGHHDVGIENLVERKKINKQYLRSSGLKWDLVASFPAYTPFPSGSLVASLCRLPRLVRCVELWSYLDDVIVQVQQHFASHNVSAFLGPIKLLIVLVLVAHYVGCIFFLISERECEYLDRCWMTHDPLLHGYHENIPMLYAKSFYWAITTLLLVGSREIVPRGMAGTLWTGFTCLLCTFVIGHIVGEISELILSLGKETKLYKSRIAYFESFANEHELTPDLRERVIYFFQVEFQHTKGIDMRKTMHDLSANLRLKFMLELYGRSVEQLPISSFLTATQINNLTLRLQSELFIPGDNILVEGTFGSRLCTLCKGLAAAYWTKSITSVAVLTEGAFFGEIAFFLPNQRRLATVRATSSCEILSISKHDWQELWMSSDDPSESNVQKHAQYAVLGWVNSRLQRYQRGCLRTVRRAQTTTTEVVASNQSALVRSRSLPFFGDSFFRDRELFRGYYQLANDERKGDSGIDFEILQRCQRPQYATQLQWYHRYRQWKSNRKGITVLQSLFAPETSRLDQALKTNQVGRPFIRHVKLVGKIWDLVMVLASVYYLLVTPFKICFSYKLTQLPAGVLDSWSGFEIFLDVLSFMDLVYKLCHSSSKKDGTFIATIRSFSSNTRIRQAFSFPTELRGDIVAMLPLELLLFVVDVKLPTIHLSQSIESTNALWWTSRWILRINRMLLFRRIQPLSEELIHFVTHDLNLPISEELLYFVREMATYITMGHLLACIWYITSEIGLYYYGLSWLIDSRNVAVRFTREPIIRQYLRPLLFSMECISTLFNGDIISMNPVELIAEIMITFWSIYIYGALIGAQGEWLDSQARHKAAFEQNLTELQHFLTQNDVPKGLKGQVKAYFARIWRRHQGRPEFASVANVSRSLYEDVVLATQRDFTSQVRVFRVLDDNFLRGLLVCLEYVVCSEGEEVVTKGDMDRSMYFIAQGQILVGMDCGEIMRDRGEFFGEFALLYGISRLETCTALSVAELYRLDHEPYEKLLHDFPGYRRRNKLSWTTPVPTRDSVLRANDYSRNTTPTILDMAPILANRSSVRKLDAVRTQSIENELTHSYVYKSTIEMLAQLQTMHPEEAKSLILKVRAGSRKRLSR